MTIQASMIPQTVDLSSSVDDSTIEYVADKLQVKDSGIVAAKLATDAVETAKIKAANVTLAKLDASVSLGFIGFFHRVIWAGNNVPTLGADSITVANAATNTYSSQMGFQAVNATSWTYKTLDVLCEASAANNARLILGFTDNAATTNNPVNGVNIYMLSGAPTFETSRASAKTSTNVGSFASKLSRKFVWANGNAKYYENGSLSAEHTTNVPTVAMYVTANTNTGDPGGIGSIKIYSMLVY